MRDARRVQEVYLEEITDAGTLRTRVMYTDGDPTFAGLFAGRQAAMAWIRRNRKNWRLVHRPQETAA